MPVHLEKITFFTAPLLNNKVCSIINIQMNVVCGSAYVREEVPVLGVEQGAPDPCLVTRQPTVLNSTIISIVYVVVGT